MASPPAHGSGFPRKRSVSTAFTPSSATAPLPRKLSVATLDPHHHHHHHRTPSITGAASSAAPSVTGSAGPHGGAQDDDDEEEDDVNDYGSTRVVAGSSQSRDAQLAAEKERLK